MGFGYFYLIEFIDINIYIYVRVIVQALRDIAHTIGKKNWNYSVDPCTGKSNWNSSEKNVVTCNCSFVNHTCHVVSMYVSLSFYL